MLHFLLILVILLVLDGVYIGMQISFFKKLYNKIQGKPLVPRIEGAILCYIFIIFILYYFILSSKQSPLNAFILGVCVYGIYNTTTYTLLSDFPLRLVFTDTLWGGILFGLTSFMYYKILNISYKRY